MICTIDRDTFFCSQRRIRDSGVSCHITNDDTHLFDVIDINKLIQGSSRIMSALKKCKLHISVWQADGTEWVHTLWLMKFSPKAGANLFSLTCKLLQGKTISSDHQNNIMVKSTDGDIILDHGIETQWWLGSQSRVSSRNQWCVGTISYCSSQEKYQWPTCWT